MFFYEINYVQPMHAKIMKNIFAIFLYNTFQQTYIKI